MVDQRTDSPPQIGVPLPVVVILLVLGTLNSGCPAPATGGVRGVPPFFLSQREAPAEPDKSPARSEEGADSQESPPANPQADGIFPVPLREPSGVAYDPVRRTLWVVCDHGSLVEMDSNYQVLSERMIRGDLEGVAVHPITGNVWIASERAGLLLEYDVSGARVIRKLRIDFDSHGDFAAKPRGNKGVEGLAFGKEPGGPYHLFCVTESNPARLIRLSADFTPEATQRARRTFDLSSRAGLEEEIAVIDRSVDVGLARLSDITFVESPPMLVTVSAGLSVVTSFDLRGTLLRSVPIPAIRPEGLCFLPGGDGILALDLEYGLFAFRRGLLSALKP